MLDIREEVKMPLLLLEMLARKSLEEDYYIANVVPQSALHFQLNMPFKKYFCWNYRRDQTYQQRADWLAKYMVHHLTGKGKPHKKEQVSYQLF